MTVYRKDPTIGLNLELFSTNISPINGSPVSSRGQGQNLVGGFPEMKQNFVRKGTHQGRSPSNQIHSPQSLSSLASLGLFPMQPISPGPTRGSPIGKIGVPFGKLAVEKFSSFSRPSSVRKASTKSPERNISQSRLSSEVSLFKKLSSKEMNTQLSKKIETIRKVPNLQVNSLFRKLQTGRANIENLSESDLIQLALDSICKNRASRGATDIAILSRCMSNVNLFKDEDSKTMEGLFKAMRYFSMKAGEIVYTKNDIGTNMWVLLKGKVEMHENEGMTIILPVCGFGEQGLFEKRTRNATVICREDCEFALVDKVFYKEAKKDEIARKLNANVNFLNEIPCFKGWSYKSTMELFNQSLLKDFKKGNVIYNEDDESDKMYIIKNGQFKVVKELEMNDLEGDSKSTKRARKIIEVALLGEREVFGEECFLSCEKREFKVICASLEGQAFEVDKKEFLKILKNFETRTWLEESAKVRKLYYQERIKSVQSATKNYKHLLLFPKAPPSYSQKKEEILVSVWSSETPAAQARRLSCGPSIEELNYPQAPLLGKNLKKKLELCTNDYDLMPSSRETREYFGLWSQSVEKRNRIRSKSKLNTRQDVRKPFKSQTVKAATMTKFTATTPRLSFVASPRVPGVETERLYNTKSLVDILAEEKESDKLASHRNFFRSSFASLNDKFFEKTLYTERTRVKKSQGSISSGALEENKPPIFSHRQSHGGGTLDQLDDEEKEAGGSACQIMSLPVRSTTQIKERKSSIHEKEVKDILERGFNYKTINWGQQRQKVKNMLEEKTEREYKRNFCILENDKVSSAFEGGQRYKLFIDQIDEEDEVENDMRLNMKKARSVPLIPGQHQPKVKSLGDKFNFMNRKPLI